MKSFLNLGLQTVLCVFESTLKELINAALICAELIFAELIFAQILKK